MKRPIYTVPTTTVALWAINKLFPSWSDLVVAAVMIVLALYIVVTQTRSRPLSRDTASWSWGYHLSAWGIFLVILGVIHFTLQSMKWPEDLDWRAVPTWLSILVMAYLTTRAMLDVLFHLSRRFVHEMVAAMIGVATLTALFIVGARISALSEFGPKTVSTILVLLGGTLIMEAALLALKPKARQLPNAILSGLWTAVVIVTTLGLFALYDRVTDHTAFWTGIALAIFSMLMTVIAFVLAMGASKDIDIFRHRIAVVFYLGTTAASVATLAWIYLG